MVWKLAMWVVEVLLVFGIEHADWLAAPRTRALGMLSDWLYIENTAPPQQG